MPAQSQKALFTEETCTQYNVLKITRALFRYTGASALADFYEKAILNGILGTQRMPLGYTSKDYHGPGSNSPTPQQTLSFYSPRPLPVAQSSNPLILKDLGGPLTADLPSQSNSTVVAQQAPNWRAEAMQQFPGPAPAAAASQLQQVLHKLSQAGSWARGKLLQALGPLGVPTQGWGGDGGSTDPGPGETGCLAADPCLCQVAGCSE